LCWVGVHLQRSDNVSNISYLNSPLPPILPYPPSPTSWNSFNKYHFCTYHFLILQFPIAPLHLFNLLCPLFIPLLLCPSRGNSFRFQNQFSAFSVISQFTVWESLPIIVLEASTGKS
jgi:hypothetical protein